MLRTIRSAIRLTARERQLAARALGWLLVADIALRARGFPSVRRALDRVRTRAVDRPRTTPADCETAMRRACHVYPPARCLARAVAAAALLRRDGVESVLHIGIGFDETRGFEAHAWLESAGVIVTGGGTTVPARRLFRHAVVPTP